MNSNYCLASLAWPKCKYCSVLMPIEVDQCVQVDKRELADAQWFSSDDIRLMLTDQHPSGYFCPPPQAIAHQLIKHSLTLTSML